jgi:hypothetical protein
MNSKIFYKDWHSFKNIILLRKENLYEPPKKVFGHDRTPEYFKAKFLAFNSILRQLELIKTEFQLFRSHEYRMLYKNYNT